MPIVYVETIFFFFSKKLILRRFIEEKKFNIRLEKMIPSDQIKPFWVVKREKKNIRFISSDSSRVN